MVGVIVGVGVLVGVGVIVGVEVAVGEAVAVGTVVAVGVAVGSTGAQAEINPINKTTDTITFFILNSPMFAMMVFNAYFSSFSSYAFTIRVEYYLAQSYILQHVF